MIDACGSVLYVSGAVDIVAETTPLTHTSIVLQWLVIPGGTVLTTRANNWIILYLDVKYLDYTPFEV